ncbi:MmcQ/YjbR family DNA-binding protein [Pikeienuella sp. HZG-20]|uniref:MmcQ/YjbR family DNA-binding protein n=1 Tax=Paludibacillus litoralis TaxID=3133267 RepID=UPI0030EF85BD
MNRARFDEVCAAFSGARNVIQWGGASVWKIGGKVFAIHSEWGDGEGVVLKPSEMAREIWRDAPGVGLAPYLGRAGWIRIASGAMPEPDLIGLIGASHALIAARLTKRARAELGIL